MAFEVCLEGTLQCVGKPYEVYRRVMRCECKVSKEDSLRFMGKISVVCRKDSPWCVDTSI